MSDAVVHPHRAPVVPRAMPASGGGCLPIETLVRRAFFGHPCGSVAIVGPPGSGKSTALEDLAARGASDLGLMLLDEPTLSDVASVAPCARVVYTSRERVLPPVLAWLEPAGWDDDDAIEYLLAVHRGRCDSVMKRLRLDERRSMLSGSPELWHIALDEMAREDSIACTGEALCRYLDRVLNDDELLESAGWVALQALRDKVPFEDLLKRKDDCLGAALGVPAAARLLRHRAAQVMIAADRITWNLARDEDRGDLRSPLPRELVNEVARRARHRPAALETLYRYGSKNYGGRSTAMAASILVSADKTWRSPASAGILIGAFLAGAQWPGVDLSNADLTSADLSRANLGSARLVEATASCAIFHRANLQHADLRQLNATDADLTGADLAEVTADGATFHSASLAGADLSRARLCRAKFAGTDLCQAKLTVADLRGAHLDHVKLTGTDLRRANLACAKCAAVRLAEAKLDGADFTRAVLRNCELEGVELRNAKFRRANLSGSDLTASVMPDADFRQTRLINCGLAEVEWERADLRGADFTGASFHMGSTRCGLVGSVIPCEGSKTGFYTDELEEQDYKSPEEIRKANLCGADLRGAEVEGTDWYLVDLRGARYTRGQREYFAKCGAILDAQSFEK